MRKSLYKRIFDQIISSCVGCRTDGCMVDYSICGIELDKEKLYSKTIIIRKDENESYFRRELQMDSAGVREFFAWAIHIWGQLISEMYSLSDFPEVRYETTKIYKFYTKGISCIG